MAPPFVKPYVKSQKNDANDAEAICEAVQRPAMRFVPVKTVGQQSILQLHHARRLLTKMRVELSNHMRAMLLEYGIALPKGVKALPARLPAILENAENGLTDKETTTTSSATAGSKRPGITCARADGVLLPAARLHRG